MPHAVLTRDVADAQAYAAVLAPLGYEIVALPVTRIAPAADPDALRRAVAGGGYACAVVASPRAAHELARARDASLAELPEVWAVGAATQRALAIARIAATHPAGVKDGAELARRVVASCAVAGKRVLLPRAEEGRPEPAEILRAAGAVVDDVVAYRTLPTPPDDAGLVPGLEVLRAGRAAITCVFAPSQVSALGKLLDLPVAQTRFVAIGETTATALRDAGVTAVSVADAPTPEGIAKAARAVYR